MDLKVLKNLITYHQDGLDQYRQHMGPSAQYLEEQTIIALKELGHIEEMEASAQETVKAARAILERK